VLTEATAATVAAKYLRISLDRNQDEAGVTRQDEDTGQLIAERRYALTAAHGPGCAPGTFSDNDISAAKGRPRPGYEALMAAAQRGEFTVICVFHLSRLWRNRVERAQGIEVLRKAGVSVVCAKGPSLDFSSAYGRGVAAMIGEVDTLESELKGERAYAAQARAAQAGLHLGGARPFGWDLVPDPRREGRPDAHRPVLPVVNEAEAAELRRLAAEVLRGRSLASLCDDLNARGVRTVHGKPWVVQSLRGALRRERNYGVATFDGARHEGAWPAILDEATVRKVTALLDDPGRRTSTTNKVKSLLTGIATCGRCGETVKTGGRGRSGARRRVYKCGREHLYRLQEAVDHVVTAEVIGRLADMTPEQRAALFTEDDPGAPVAAEAAEIRRRLALLVDMELDGTITREEHRQRRAGLRAQLTAAERRMGAVSRTPVLAGFLAAEDIRGAWGALPLDRKRAILPALVSVVILPAVPGKTLSRHEPAWNAFNVGVGVRWNLTGSADSQSAGEWLAGLDAQGPPA
jgi:DNA invertase Pin-like site-specific DNA recombinase